MRHIHQRIREDHMGRSHPSTPEQRAQWASQMLARDHEYGTISLLRATIGVSRPTLYAWKARPPGFIAFSQVQQRLAPSALVAAAHADHRTPSCAAGGRSESA